MAKQILWGQWLYLGATQYKIRDGSSYSENLNAREINQRGSGDVTAQWTNAGLADDASVSVDIICDEDEAAAIDALIGTTVADVSIKKSDGTGKVFECASVYFNRTAGGTMGDNLVRSVTLRPLVLPTTPNLAHLDPTA